MQQEDPLGPFLFSLVIKVMLAETDPEGVPLFPLDDLYANIWYLDDGFTAGPEEVVHRVLELLCARGP